MNKRSTFIGEYALLDSIPNIDATNEGIKVNLYEPNSSSYYTKVFQKKDSQVFIIRTPGIHKVWFEGSKYLFQTVDAVRVSIKIRDDIKYDKIVDKALKTSDIKQAQETMMNLGTAINQIVNAIEDGDKKLKDFEDLKNQYISRMAWSYIITVLIILGCTGFEAYLFRRAILKSVDKFK